MSGIDTLHVNYKFVEPLILLAPDLDWLKMSGANF